MDYLPILCVEHMTENGVIRLYPDSDNFNESTEFPVFIDYRLSGNEIDIKLTEALSLIDNEILTGNIIHAYFVAGGSIQFLKKRLVNSEPDFERRLEISYNQKNTKASKRLFIKEYLIPKISKDLWNYRRQLGLSKNLEIIESAEGFLDFLREKERRLSIEEHNKDRIEKMSNEPEIDEIGAVLEKIKEAKGRAEEKKNSQLTNSEKPFSKSKYAHGEKKHVGMLIFLKIEKKIISDISGHSKEDQLPMIESILNEEGFYDISAATIQAYLYDFKNNHKDPRILNGAIKLLEKQNMERNAEVIEYAKELLSEKPKPSK
ncbi:MAG: hypothetical protein ACOYXB_00630 [Bacteroidota bacterium]